MTDNPTLDAALERMKALVSDHNRAGRAVVLGEPTQAVWLDDLRALVDAVEGREGECYLIMSRAFKAGAVSALSWTKCGVPQSDVDEAAHDYAAKTSGVNDKPTEIPSYLARLADRAPSPTPAAIPEGWVLVPVEPTFEMLKEGNSAALSTAVLMDDKRFACEGETYRAMISARPVPPEAKGPVVDDRYPYVYHDRATWARAGVSLSQGDDYIRVDMLLEDKPGGRWTVVEMTADEAEQMGLRLLERVKTLRAALAAALGTKE